MGPQFFPTLAQSVTSVQGVHWFGVTVPHKAGLAQFWKPQETWFPHTSRIKPQLVGPHAAVPQDVLPATLSPVLSAV
jgi:hypothetical protein